MLLVPVGVVVSARTVAGTLVRNVTSRGAPKAASRRAFPVSIASFAPSADRSRDVRAPRRIPGAALAALFVSAAVAAACGEDAVFPPPGPNLAVGTWGGDDAGIIVTESAAHVHVGCTFGDIVGTIPLGADGRFTIDGDYQPRAYPVVTGPPVPAEFRGQVAGRILTLSVTVSDTVEGGVIELGPVRLEYGREPEMRMCPICRTPPNLLAPR